MQIFRDGPVYGWDFRVSCLSLIPPADVEMALRDDSKAVAKLGILPVLSDNCLEKS